MTTESDEDARRVEEIDAAERDLLIVALDDKVPAGRQIGAWNRLLALEEAKDQILGLVGAPRA